MPFLTDAVPALATFTGAEELYLDTNLASGGQPQESKVAIYKLALLMTTMLNTLDKTMVAGTRYYVGYYVGSTTVPTPRGSTLSNQSFVITGVNVAVGSTGGTDLWNAELHDSTGATLATSLLTGTTAGTANTIQQLAFTAAVTIPSGLYYIVLQSNGTTAKFKTVNSPIWPTFTGSAIGTLGTAAAITPPTTFTANLGPMASLY